MATNNFITAPTARHLSHAAAVPQKVVIVNGTADVLALIDSALNSGHYNVVFVESSEHAYSQIKRERPELVILCVHIEDRSAFHVLSMLKLDPDTRDIPVLTYATAFEGQSPDETDPEPSEPEIFAPKAAVPMN